MIMKKNYQLPEITLFALSNEDVISTSTLNQVLEECFIHEDDKVSFGTFQDKNA